MAQYHFSKHGRYGRRVEIRKGVFRISIGALVGAFLLACLVWLYMEGYDLRHTTQEETDAAVTEAYDGVCYAFEDGVI